MPQWGAGGGVWDVVGDCPEDECQCTVTICAKQHFLYFFRSSSEWIVNRKVAYVQKNTENKL